MGILSNMQDISLDNGNSIMQQPEALGKESVQVREFAKEKRRQASRLTDIEFNEILNAILDDFIE